MASIEQSIRDKWQREAEVGVFVWIDIFVAGPPGTKLSHLSKAPSATQNAPINHVIFTTTTPFTINANMKIDTSSTSREVSRYLYIIDY